MQQRVNAFGVVRGRALPGRQGPDRGQPPGRQGRRGRPRGRSARPPSCSSTTGKRTSSTTSARPTLTLNANSAPAGHRAADRGPAGVEVHDVGIGKGSDPLADDSPGGQSQAAAKPRFYVFDKNTKKPLNDGQTFRLPRGGAGLARPRRIAPTPRSSRSRPACSSCAPSASRRTRPPIRTAGGSSRTVRACSGTDIKNPEQSFDTTLGNEPIVTFNFTDKGRKAFQAITQRVAAARRRQRARRDPLPDLAALRDRARQRARLRAVHQLAGEPGRHRRRDRRPDLRQLHDQVGAGPGEDPQDRRPAAEAHRGLALAGLRDARQAGARPGPEGGHRRLRDRRALPDLLLPRAGRHRDASRCASTRCTSTRWSS